MDELIYNQIGFSNGLINVVKQAEDYDCIKNIDLIDVKDLQLETITSTTEFVYNRVDVNEK